MSAVREAPAWTRAVSPPAIDAARRARALPIRRWPDWTAIGLIIAATALLWVPYALRARFLYDEWEGAANWTFGRAGLSWSTVTGYRPGGTVFWLLGLNTLLGADPRRHYLALCAAAAVVAVTLFVTLRLLHASRTTAALASLLLLVFPRAGSLHLWSGTIGLDLAIAVTLAGVCAGLLWAEHGRRAVVWLPIAVLLTLWGMSLYEPLAGLTLVLAALAPLARHRRRVLLVAAVQMGCALVILLEERLRLGVGPSSELPSAPTQGYASRSLTLMTDGWRSVISRLFATTGSTALLAALVAAAVAAAAVLVVRHRTVNDEPPHGRPVLTRTAITAILLLAGALLSWLIYVPADPWYDPQTLGVGDRVNGVAAVFLCTALALTAGALITVRPRLTALRATSVAAGVAFASLTTVTFIGASRDQARIYQDAGDRRDHLLAVLHSQLPQPGPDDAVLLGDVDLYDGPIWVPVFGASWDFTGAVQLVYGRPSLSGEVIDGSQRCTQHGVQLSSGWRAYGAVHIVDGDRAQVVTPPDVASCARLLHDLPARAVPHPFSE